MKKSLLNSVYTSVKGLHNAGLIDIETMHTFDALRLPPVKDLTPQEIKRLRLKEHVSQSVFAAYLNITSSTVKKWETGEKHPRGTSLKLLNLVAEKGLQGIV